ncbi:MAG: methenyltetrahydromethanopterin cyclohydrolase, partial [Burkholderiaceae bacterium]
GWSLNVVKEDNGGKPFNCLGSGPARVLANKEDLIREIAYSEISQKGVLILEVASYPPRKIIDKIINDCRLNPENLVLIITPTTSLAGTTQVVSRVLEVAMHKLHALKFPLQNVVEGFANAPLPLPSNDFLEAMGRTNDAILYGGLVQLVVSGNDSESEKLAKALPSSNSQDYGKSFSDIFKSVSYDFYKIDPMLFAPAKVIISNLDSGKSWVEGSLNLSLLEELWIETEN